MSRESGAGELDGALAPPMANGEVVFSEPWESRAFAMARQLCEAGLYSWDDFRAQLIAAIDAAPARPYFESFLTALEALLASRALVTTAALDDRADQLAARPHGHDH
ncbi:MAG: nitrile hydratase accessory protein [Pseudomonadota bacterium]